MLSFPWLKLSYEGLITHYLLEQNNAAQHDTKTCFKEILWLSKSYSEVYTVSEYLSQISEHKVQNLHCN